jgi:hypothetical protein
MGSASELMLLRTQLAQARTDQEELQAKFDRLRQMLEVQQSLTNVSERRRDETERNGATHTPEAQDIRSNARLESIETGGNDRADTSSKVSVRLMLLRHDDDPNPFFVNLCVTS